MKRNCILFFILFIISCGNLPKRNLNIKLLNSRSSNYKILEIENKTKNNVFLPYDTTYYGYNTFLSERENNIFFPKLIFFDENENEIEGIITTSAHPYFDKEYLKKGAVLIRQEYLEKQSVNRIIKIARNEKIRIKLPVKNLLYLKNPYDTLEYKIKNKTYLQLRYSIDKNLIKKVLPKTTIDSLKNMGFEFYNGKIISNKLLLREEE